MNALLKPLMKLTVLSALALAPAALARPPTCSDICNFDESCDSTCWNGHITTCRASGEPCTDTRRVGSHVSMNEQQPADEDSDASLTCHEPRQARESSTTSVEG